MIEAEYTITYADYKAANRLYLLHRPRTMIGYVLIQAIPAFGLCFLARALWLRAHGHADAPLATPAMMTGYFWLTLFFPLLRTRTLRLGYRGLFPARSSKVVRLTADERQVTLIFPEQAEGRYYWSSIEDHAENSNGLILFITKLRYLMVPHHALTETQWVEFRALIAEKQIQTR